jgi:hypothetical protein
MRVYTSKEKKKNEERVTKYTSTSGRKVKNASEENEGMNIMSSNRREKKPSKEKNVSFVDEEKKSSCRFFF